MPSRLVQEPACLWRLLLACLHVDPDHVGAQSACVKHDEVQHPKCTPGSFSSCDQAYSAQQTTCMKNMSGRTSTAHLQHARPCAPSCATNTVASRCSSSTHLQGLFALRTVCLQKTRGLHSPEEGTLCCQISTLVLVSSRGGMGAPTLDDGMQNLTRSNLLQQLGSTTSAGVPAKCLDECTAQHLTLAAVRTAWLGPSLHNHRASAPVQFASHSTVHIPCTST